MVPWMPVQYDGKYTSTNTPEGMPMDFEAMSNPVHILKTYKNMNYNTKVFGNAVLDIPYHRRFGFEDSIRC